MADDIPKSTSINNKFAGMVAVFTGVRNSDMENAIIAGGGQIGSSITGKTTIIIAKDPLENSGKINKARELGIQIVSIDDFKTNYGF
jgi:NAD-dependent DNA ligase